MIVHINSGPKWTDRLATALEQAKSGDIIVVPDYDILNLAVAAAKRLQKYPAIRIMTEKTYQEINKPASK